MLITLALIWSIYVDLLQYTIDKEESDKIDNVILRRQYPTNVGHPEYIVTNGQNDSDSGYMPNRDTDSNLVIHLGDASYRYEPKLSNGPSHTSLSSAHTEDRRSNASGPMVAHSNSSLNLMSPHSLINDINKNRSVSNNSLHIVDSLNSSRSSLQSRSNGAVTEAVVVCEYNIAYQQPSEASASIGRTEQRKSRTSGDVTAKNQKQSHTEADRHSTKVNNQRNNVPKNNNNTEGVRVISNKIQNQQSDTAVREAVASSNYAMRLSRNSINNIGSKSSLVDPVERKRTSSRDTGTGLQGVRKANSRSSLVDQQRLATSSESLHSAKRRGSRDSNASRHSVASGRGSYHPKSQGNANVSPYDQIANISYQPMMSTPVNDNQELPTNNNNEYPDYSPKKFSEFIYEGKYNQSNTNQAPNNVNRVEAPQPVTILPSTSKQVESAAVVAVLTSDDDKPNPTEEFNLRRTADSLKGNVVVSSNIDVERELKTQSVMSSASLDIDMPWSGTLESQRGSIYSNPESTTLRSAKDKFKQADRMYNDLKKMQKVDESTIIAVIQEYKEIIPILGDKYKNLRAKAHCRIARIYYNYLKKEEAAGKYARNSLHLAPENCKTEVWYKEAQDITRKVKRKEEWQDSIKRNRLSKLSDTADTKYYFTS